jgi:hypothetical protein
MSTASPTAVDSMSREDLGSSSSSSQRDHGSSSDMALVVSSARICTPSPHNGAVGAATGADAHSCRLVSAELALQVAFIKHTGPMPLPKVLDVLRQFSPDDHLFTTVPAHWPPEQRLLLDLLCVAATGEPSLYQFTSAGLEMVSLTASRIDASRQRIKELRQRLEKLPQFETTTAAHYIQVMEQSTVTSTPLAPTPPVAAAPWSLPAVRGATIDERVRLRAARQRQLEASPSFSSNHVLVVAEALSQYVRDLETRRRRRRRALDAPRFSANANTTVVSRVEPSLPLPAGAQVALGDLVEHLQQSTSRPWTGNLTKRAIVQALQEIQERIPGFVQFDVNHVRPDTMVCLKSAPGYPQLRQALVTPAVATDIPTASAVDDRATAPLDDSITKKNEAPPPPLVKVKSQLRPLPRTTPKIAPLARLISGIKRTAERIDSSNATSAGTSPIRTVTQEGDPRPTKVIRTDEQTMAISTVATPSRHDTTTNDSRLGIAPDPDSSHRSTTQSTTPRSLVHLRINPFLILSPADYHGGEILQPTRNTVRSWRSTESSGLRGGAASSARSLRALFHEMNAGKRI